MSSPSVTVVERSSTGSPLIAHQRLSAVFAPGPWLVVVPHDDDLVLGLGLTLAAAARESIPIHVAVVTDGALGYVHSHEQASLARRRAAELERAAQRLDLALPNLHRFELPDGSLLSHQGCRQAPEPATVSQRLVQLMRAIRPAHVFVCTPTDLHPDHRVCASETSMACFWASSRIWLELGEPIELPERWHYAVYCAFDGPPDLQIEGSEALFAQKLGALAEFVSQEVIEEMVENLRADGPYEYLQRVRAPLYRPQAYRALFVR